METPTRKAGVYVRISHDKTGEGLGVERQRVDCLELIKRNGWQFVDLYPDNDTSAWQHRKGRPQYERMIEDVKAGGITAVVAWHPDRLYRQARDLVGLVDLVHKYDLEVDTCTAGKVDLRTSAGRMNARVVGAIAEYESE